MSNAISKLLSEIKRINPLQANFLDNAVAALSDNDKTEFEKYLQYSLTTGVDLTYLADSYDLIVKDTLREQIFFKRNGRYRYSTYAEVAGSVYLNDEYMSRYMYGLALTSYLWLNHVQMRTFFEKEIPRDRNGSYLEIGPGHGMYFMKAMNHCSFDTYEGIDISPTSVKMTNDILHSGAFGTFTNYIVYEQDFLDLATNKKYDAIVMGEVLEHVESPEVFLKKIKSLAATDCFIYVTTCINAPAIDHISLFTSVEHLHTIVKASGLRVASELVIPYTGLTLHQSMTQKLPVNIAMVLQHA